MNTTGKISVEKINSDIIRMDQAHFPNPWTDKQWSELNPEQNRIYSLRTGDVLEGFALFGIVSGDDTAHLYKILIHPDCRGSQVSHHFWSNILLDLKNLGMKSVYLEVESENLRAISFYEKNGFKLLRRNRAYYSNGEDALVMSLTL